MLYGRSFSKVFKVDFSYSDSSLTPNSASSILIHGSSAISVRGIKNTKNPFYIKAFTSEGFTSNDFTVIPIYFNSTITPTPTPTPTPTSTTTPTTTPTTPPTKLIELAQEGFFFFLY
ncbi:hypothetical protein ACTFIY_006640 [Dictyostelium cf. discoideum]